MNWNDFVTWLSKMNWNDFVPNLIATFVGVFVPIILAIGDNGIKRNKDKTEEKIKLLNTLDKLIDSLTYNKGHLDSLDKTIHREVDNVKIAFPVDFLTWEEFKNDTYKYFNIVNLRHKLTKYFLQLNNLVKLQDLYLEYAIKIDEPDQSNNKVYWQGLIQEIWVNLESFLKEALKYQNGLAEDIQTEIKELEKK
jgi:hypothetical protein